MKQKPPCSVGPAIRPPIVGVVSEWAALRSLPVRRRPFDWVELRADLLSAAAARLPAACRRLRRAGVPVLLTIRSAAEGGAWTGTDAERLAWYRRLLPLVDVVDVEIRSGLLRRLVPAAHAAGLMVIGSFHDFKGMPAATGLRRIMAAGVRQGADIVKLAVTLHAAGDEAVLRRLLRAPQPKPLCVIGMGAPAVRVRLARTGSCLAYATLGRVVAPGQLTCRELAAALRAGR